MAIFLNSSIHRLAQSADSLHPAKAFFDTLSDLLVDGIVQIIGRSAVNGRFPVFVVLCHVRCDFQPAQFP